jgi:hypothetical protein
VDDSTVPTNHLRDAFTGGPGALTEPATRQAFQAQIDNALGFPELDPNGPPPGLVHVQAARVYRFATAVTSFVPSLRAWPSAAELADRLQPNCRRSWATRPYPPRVSGTAHHGAC